VITMGCPAVCERLCCQRSSGDEPPRNPQTTLPRMLRHVARFC